MITIDKLTQNVCNTVDETKIALQTVWDALSHGQQNKMIKVPEVKALFDRYEVGNR